MWEGFRVRSPSGHLGFVEEVRRGFDSGEPEVVVVRAGRVIVLTVPVDEIDDVLQTERLVLVSETVSRHVPDYLLRVA